MSFDNEKKFDVRAEHDDSSDGLNITQTELVEAQQDALSKPRAPWQVIKENIKTCAVVLVVQVSAPQIPQVNRCSPYLPPWHPADQWHHSRT